MEKQEKHDGQISIDLTEDKVTGQYANLAVMTHSSAEFVLDFLALLPGMQKARVQSRIILAPEHAKRLLRALQENISRYEQSFGEIQLAPSRGLPPLSPFKGEA